MMRSALLLFIFITPTVLALSLVKLNESQKVGLPSFMYSHFNISDVNGVKNVIENFFSNVKSSISEYVDILSGSENKKSAEAMDLVEEVIGYVADEKAIEDGVKEEVDESNQEESQEEVEESVEQNKKPQQRVPITDNKIEEKPKQNVQSSQGSQNEKQTNKNFPQVEQKESESAEKKEVPLQDNKKLPIKNAQVATDKAQPKTDEKVIQQNIKKEENIENKANSAGSVKPAQGGKKSEEVKTNQINDQKPAIKKTEVKQPAQTEKVQADSELHNKEAKQAAEKLRAVLKNLDKSIEQFVTKYRGSNPASRAWGQYEAAVKSAAGSKCAVNKATDSAGRVDQVFKSCTESARPASEEELKEKIAEAVEKVKDADYNLRLTTDLCSSVKEPNSDVCEEAKARSLNAINNVSSQVEVQKLYGLANKVLSEVNKSLESCVQDNTKSLQQDWASWTKEINDCLADLKEL